MELKRGGQTLVGYPALVDRGDAVDLEVFDAPTGRRRRIARGCAVSSCCGSRNRRRYVEKSLPGLQAMVLQYASLGDANELRTQLVAAAFERACMADPLPRDAADFARRCEEARSRVALIAQELARLVGAILAEHQALQKKLQAAKAFPEAVRDIERAARAADAEGLRRRDAVGAAAALSRAT